MEEKASSEFGPSPSDSPSLRKEGKEHRKHSRDSWGESDSRKWDKENDRDYRRRYFLIFVRYTLKLHRHDRSPERRQSWGRPFSGGFKRKQEEGK